MNKKWGMEYREFGEVLGVPFLRKFLVPAAHRNFLPQGRGSQKSKTVYFFSIPFDSQLH